MGSRKQTARDSTFNWLLGSVSAEFVQDWKEKETEQLKKKNHQSIWLSQKNQRIFKIFSSHEM